LFVRPTLRTEANAGEGEHGRGDNRHFHAVKWSRD